MHIEQTRSSGRVFKTAWFARTAKKAHITDLELCSIIQQVALGQAVDLGGGVFKKRLGKNLYRVIILGRGSRFWVYEYLFAKKDRENIGDNELADFRKLAKVYETLGEQQIGRLVHGKSWMEICDGSEA